MQSEGNWSHQQQRPGTRGKLRMSKCLSKRLDMSQRHSHGIESQKPCLLSERGNARLHVSHYFDLTQHFSFLPSYHCSLPFRGLNSNLRQTSHSTAQLWIITQRKFLTENISEQVIRESLTFLINTDTSWGIWSWALFCRWRAKFPWAYSAPFLLCPAPSQKWIETVVLNTLP